MKMNIYISMCVYICCYCGCSYNRDLKINLYLSLPRNSSLQNPDHELVHFSFLLILLLLLFLCLL